MRDTPKSAYVVAIIVNAILLYVVNNLLNWNVPFITEAFTATLWAINLSLGATIAANVLFLVYDRRWFRRLAGVALNVFAFIAAYTVYTVFPFDFDQAIWALLVRIGLIAAMVGTGIALIVDLGRLIFGR